MELQRLTVENFRQFYGEQTIEFAEGGETNVTVIHGSNGSGKTTLLNAYTWLLYDSISLPKPDHITSERALAEIEPGDTVSVAAELEFTHEGSRHVFRREREMARTSDTELDGREQREEVTLRYTDENGNMKTRANPTTAVQQIMPERLREIFFFDGETIDKMVTEDQEKITEAIRNIMGLEILDRSERHLEHVAGEFTDEMDEHGSEELQQVIAEQDDINSRIEEIDTELSNTKESKATAEEELAEVRQRLSEREKSRELEQQRQSLKEDIEDIEADIETIEDEIASLIADDGMLPFAMPAIERTGEMLKEKRQKGEIPSEIKAKFVDDLLEAKECICGRPLKKDTEERQKVAAWRERAGSSELEEMAMTIAGRLTEMATHQEEFYTQLDDKIDQRSDKKDRKIKLEEEIDEISSKLKDEAGEEISKLESRREALEIDISDYDQEIGSLVEQKSVKKDELKEVKKRRDTVKKENEKSKVARRRAQTAEYLAGRVSQLHERFQDQVRKSVNDRVNEIYQEIMAKDYYIEVSEDYRLKFKKPMKDESDVEVAVSTGERQVASLSFIATLVSLARERFEEEEDSVYFTGGVYPMVMDSPFGSLDPQYQKNVSQMAPEMAEQVVVLLTDAQWSSEVSGEMAPRTGQEYDLIYHDPQDSDDPAEYEYTEIRQATGAAI